MPPIEFYAEGPRPADPNRIASFFDDLVDQSGHYDRKKLNALTESITDSVIEALRRNYPGEAIPDRFYVRQRVEHRLLVLIQASS